LTRTHRLSEKEIMQQADVVIVGAGVAGLTAAMTAAGCGLRTLVVEQLAPGGQIANAEKIRNFPGFPDGIAGYELFPMLQQQAEDAGAAFQLETVLAIEGDERGYNVTCENQSISAGSVILAAGSTLKRLGVEGEAAFRGRGVSHCAACDGPLFKGQPTIVVGGGDSAFDEALVLAEFASEVTVVHRGRRPAARDATVRLVEAAANIRVLPNAEIATIVGDEKVTGVQVRSGGHLELKSCRGVFVYIGLAPATGFLEGFVDLDAEGRIVTDLMMRTSRPGLFAAGDIRAQSSGLLASIAGDGATAGWAAARFMRTADRQVIGARGDHIGA
jgi:thioredoxin reductase (NADPH)